MAKLKTPEQKERERNSRLLRTYGISSDEYDQMLKEQNYGCKICGSNGGERRLHIDHDHKYKYLKIETYKAGVWFAFSSYNGKNYADIGGTKSQAIQAVRATLKKNSVRSLLCWPCNRGLQSWRDNPELLRNAAIYLERFRGQHDLNISQNA